MKRDVKGIGTFLSDDIGSIGCPGHNNVIPIEEFYRFVHENDLRKEAKFILDTILLDMKKNMSKKVKVKKINKVIH